MLGKENADREGKDGARGGRNLSEEGPEVVRAEVGKGRGGRKRQHWSSALRLIGKSGVIQCQVSQACQHLSQRQRQREAQKYL
jgi:hypothetical protein